MNEEGGGTGRRIFQIKVQLMISICVRHTGPGFGRFSMSSRSLGYFLFFIFFTFVTLHSTFWDTHRSTSSHTTISTKQSECFTTTTTTYKTLSHDRSFFPILDNHNNIYGRIYFKEDDIDASPCVHSVCIGRGLQPEATLGYVSSATKKSIANKDCHSTHTSLPSGQMLSTRSST